MTSISPDPQRDDAAQQDGGREDGMAIEHPSAARSNRIVTVASAVTVAAFLGLGAAFAGGASSVLGAMLDSTLFGLKWYYVALVAFVPPFVVCDLMG